MDRWNSEIASSLYKHLGGDFPIQHLVIHAVKFDDPLKTELVPTMLDESQGSYDATFYT
ncbi:hypothetical protein F4803DRAFT_517222 [Xylaria telfairii]|nr:hypothetical protein F4803DRAFT_517222 [Xylaria telfairii]